MHACVDGVNSPLIDAYVFLCIMVGTYRSYICTYVCNYACMHACNLCMYVCASGYSHSLVVEKLACWTVKLCVMVSVLDDQSKGWASKSTSVQKEGRARSLFRSCPVPRRALGCNRSTSNLCCRWEDQTTGRGTPPPSLYSMPRLRNGVINITQPRLPLKVI